MTIYDLVAGAHNNAINKGFWPKNEPWNLAEKLALIHSEVSEALECDRIGANYTVINEDGKPEGFPSELADIVIRIADLCGKLNINLEEEIIQKMRFNATRPAKHGKNY